MESIIRHSGYIVQEDKQQYYVSILAESACAACHAKGMCSSADKTDKIIEVRKNSFETFKIGDYVTIEMNQSSGTKAVIIAYIVPFFILIITFIIANIYIQNQGIVGILSLISMLPYFIILWFFRGKHKDKFEFRIIK